MERRTIEAKVKAAMDSGMFAIGSPCYIIFDAMAKSGKDYVYDKDIHDDKMRSALLMTWHPGLFDNIDFDG
jgi:hypothetical protein